jgi:hypothetical protein
MLALIKQQGEQQMATQAAAAKAQRDALITGQNTAAQSAMLQAQQQAQQNLGRQNQMQQMQDASALATAQKAAQGAGAAVAGAGYDINAANAAKMGNLGAASSTLPGTGANAAGNPANNKNPALTTAASAGRANQFAMPSSAGLTFGGY